jgi:hypothetical protein
MSREAQLMMPYVKAAEMGDYACNWSLKKGSKSPARARLVITEKVLVNIDDQNEGRFRATFSGTRFVKCSIVAFSL